MLSRHFPVAWACSGGDRRRGRGQTAELAPGASVTAPALWPVIPRHPAPATDSPGWVSPVPPVEGERHTLQTLKPARIQSMAGNSKPAAELRIGTVKCERLGKRDRRAHPSQRHLFTDLPRRGPVEDHSEPRFQQPALRCQARRPRHTPSLQSARPRQPARLAMTKLRKTTAPSGGGGFTPVAFFLDA